MSDCSACDSLFWSLLLTTTHSLTPRNKSYVNSFRALVRVCRGFSVTATHLNVVQERATKISHGNTARHAKDYGDGVLGKICGHIASDEGRHEIAYSRIVEKFFELCVLRPSRLPSSRAH